MSVRSVVRSRFSVNYDEKRNERENDHSRVTNDIFALQSLKYDISMIKKILGCSNMFRISINAKRHSFAKFAK